MSHINICGPVFQAKGTVGTKAWKDAWVCSFKGQKGQCDHSILNKGRMPGNELGKVVAGQILWTPSGHVSPF